MSLGPVNVKLHDQRTVGQKAVDDFTNAFGTWTYIIDQTVVIIVWMAINVIGVINKVGPIPVHPVEPRLQRD